MISDLLFDLGNVLVPLDWDRAFGRLSVYLSEDMVRLLQTDRPAFEALFAEPAVALGEGRIDFAEFHKIVSEKLAISVDLREFRTIWCDIFDLDEKMVALVDTLSSKYGVWLVSNTSRAHWRHITAKWPVLSLFKGAALSFELNCMKPSPEYYRKAVEMFGVNPKSSVFIDDLVDNVQGAVRFGLNGIVFLNRDQLIADLHKLGIRVPGY
jgi:putative hydrolase of the HAD superfamily